MFETTSDDDFSANKNSLYRRTCTAWYFTASNQLFHLELTASGGALACTNSFTMRKLTHLISSHPCHKGCNLRAIVVVLPGLTHQIDDMAETGYMDTVGHHSFQNLLVCLQALG
jgi:hypothetical protein